MCGTPCIFDNSCHSFQVNYVLCCFLLLYLLLSLLKNCLCIVKHNTQELHRNIVRRKHRKNCENKNRRNFKKKTSQELRIKNREIAKAALNKLPGKSSLNVRSVCPLLTCLSCVICLSWFNWYMDLPWTILGPHHFREECKLFYGRLATKIICLMGQSRSLKSNLLGTSLKSCHCWSERPNGSHGAWWSPAEPPPDSEFLSFLRISELFRFI